MGGLTDFTSTSLGYVIAIVLPGFSALYAASLFTDSLGPISHEVEASAVGLGLFLILLLTAMTVGLVLGAIRWIVYEKGICRSEVLGNTGFAKLDSSERLATFRMLIDEQYRYHQFFGAISLVFPFIAIKLSLLHASHLASWQLVLASLACGAIEMILILGAKDSFARCVVRQSQLLGEDQPPGGTSPP